MSAKLTGERTGSEKWFPFYAGYSSQFVRRILEGAALRRDGVVLDPWAGSGTTLAVAQEMGLRGVGVDINPVAALVSAARLAHWSDVALSLGLAKQILAQASRNADRIDVPRPDPLRAWIPASVRQRFYAVRETLLELLGSREGVVLNPLKEALSPFAAFYLLSLIRAAKRLARMRRGSNPVWFRPASKGIASSCADLDAAFLALIHSGVEDLRLTRSNTSGGRVILGDAKSLPLEDESVDAFVASPPYCTRLDYFVSAAFELAALGVSTDAEAFRASRLAAMGTTLLRPSDQGTPGSPVEQFPKEVRQLLRRIKNHPSKASASYYYPTYLQYFDDVARSFGELSRVMRAGSFGVLVVQTSYYKEVPVHLGELLSSVAKMHGLSGSVASRRPVRKVLATLRAKRDSRSGREREYYEEFVLVSKVAVRQNTEYAGG